MSCGADTTANTLLTSLVGDKAFNLPDIDLSDDLFKIPDGTGDLYAGIDKLTNEDLTTRVVGGSGVFDALMDGMSKHLKAEYEANRITGEQYTKAYIAGVGGALQMGVSFLLGRDQAYWAAIQAQMQARLVEVQVVLSRVNIETAKIQLAEAKMRALIAEAEFGLTKMKIATEDQQFCLLKQQTISVEYNNNNILPAQWDGMKLDNNTKTYTNANILPAQLADIRADTLNKGVQKTAMEADISMTEVQTQKATYELASLLPAQLAGIVADTANKTAQKAGIEADTLLTSTQNSKVSYEVTSMLPAQLAGIEADTANKTAQKAGIEAETLLTGTQNSKVSYEVASMMPAQLAGIEADNTGKVYTNTNILPAQWEGLVADNATKVYTNTNILPAQLADITAGTDVKTAQEAQIIYETASILPAQLGKITADTNLVGSQQDKIDYEVGTLMPLQSAQLTLQNTGLGLDNDTKSYTLLQILPTQKTLLEEQVEVQRAQTLDTRTNGVTITGSVGKQKDLYTQQIISYQRDAEVKAAKLFTDAWITQKTIDEGLNAPGAFRNDSINVILRNIKANNYIDTNPGAQDGDPDPAP